MEEETHGNPEVKTGVIRTPPCMQVTTRIQKKQGQAHCLVPLKGVQLCWHFGFGSMILSGALSKSHLLSSYIAQEGTPSLSSPLLHCPRRCQTNSTEHGFVYLQTPQSREQFYSSPASPFQGFPCGRQKIIL